MIADNAATSGSITVTTDIVVITIPADIGKLVAWIGSCGIARVFGWLIKRVVSIVHDNHIACTRPGIFKAKYFLLFSSSKSKSAKVGWVIGERKVVKLGVFCGCTDVRTECPAGICFRLNILHSELHTVRTTNVWHAQRDLRR